MPTNVKPILIYYVIYILQSLEYIYKILASATLRKFKNNVKFHFKSFVARQIPKSYSVTIQFI